MTNSDKTAESVLQRWDQLKAARLVYEPQWEDIQKLVRVNATTLYKSQEGDRRFDGIFDGTAVESLEQLAAGCHSYLTNPAERWFELTIERMHEIRDDPQALLWLERVSDIIYDAYKQAGANFNGAFCEGYLDMGAFGHCIIMQEKDYDTCILFRAYPVADCWIAENSRSMVDTLFRQFKWTGRQIREEWPDAPEDFSKKENIDKEFCCVHAVFPRKDRDVMKVNASNKAFASVYVCAEMKCTLSEGGYDEFPYHVPRWFKLSNERYGRSPAMKCLPDIRMLNRMEITTLRAGQKAVDPALVVSDDGFLLPIKTHPGAIIFKEPMAPEIQVLETKANLPWAEEKAEQKRNAIRQAFHVDWLKLEKDNQEMTAFEVQDRRDEKLRMLTPMLSRLHGELLEPALRRTYNLLNERGYIPPAPASLRNKKLQVSYVHTAAKAQAGTKAVNIGRFFNDIAPIMQLRPDAADSVNFDAAVTELALARGTTRRIIRTPEEVATTRANNQKQQQLATLAGAAEPASKAVLNLAKAKEAGGGIGV
jgi:hypothetical protein